MEGKTILLVEDNSDDEALTLLALKKHNLTNNIDVVRDGAAAVDYLFCRGAYSERGQAENPQLILLDLKLPKMDGLEVLKVIRENEKTKHIPVVMLTTSVEESDVVSSYDNGANSFMRKPVDFKEFIEVVSHIGIYWLAFNKVPIK